MGDLICWSIVSLPFLIGLALCIYVLYRLFRSIASVSLVGIAPGIIFISSVCGGLLGVLLRTIWSYYNTYWGGYSAYIAVYDDLIIGVVFGALPGLVIGAVIGLIITGILATKFRFGSYAG